MPARSTLAQSALLARVAVFATALRALSMGGSVRISTRLQTPLSASQKAEKHDRNISCLDHVKDAALKGRVSVGVPYKEGNDRACPWFAVLIGAVHPRRRVDRFKEHLRMVRQREKEPSEERTLRLLHGRLTSLAAMHGWNEFEHAWALARPLVSEEFKSRGRPFALKVARRLDRVPSVDEATG